MRKTAPAKFHSILIPSFPFGAKRPVMDNGYLRSLRESRVLVSTYSDNISADIIILANGFETQQLLNTHEDTSATWGAFT
jgi:hypothetical protein